MVPIVRRVRGENELEWDGEASRPLGVLRPVGIEMLDRELIAEDQLLQREVVATGRSKSEKPQRLGDAARSRNGFSNLLFGVLRLPRHARTLVRVPDGKVPSLQAFM
jgi:hypothetical protein